MCVRWIHTAQNCLTDRHAIRCVDSRGLKEQPVGYGRYSHHWKGHLVEHTYTCGGNVTSAGWQVTLCDPMWHVSSRSGVATLRTAIHLLLTVTYVLGQRRAGDRYTQQTQRYSQGAAAMRPLATCLLSTREIMDIHVTLSTVS